MSIMGNVRCLDSNMGKFSEMTETRGKTVCSLHHLLDHSGFRLLVNWDFNLNRS